MPDGEKEQPRTEDLVVVFDLEILARFRSSRSTGTNSLVSSIPLLLVFILLSASSCSCLRSSGRSRFPRPAVRRRRRSLFPLRSRGTPAAVAGRRFGPLGRPFTRTGLDARRNLEVFFFVVVFVVVVIIFLVVNVFDRAFVRGRSCPGKMWSKSAPTLHPPPPPGLLQVRQRAAPASVSARVCAAPLLLWQAGDTRERSLPSLPASHRARSCRRSKRQRAGLTA